MAANLDLVRSIYADWERGDWSSATWAHPDIEYVMVDEPGSNVYVGLTEMARAWRSYLSAWEDYRIEPVEYRSLDGERVLVVVRAHGRGKSSGVELDERTRGSGGANLFHIRDGKVIRLDAYFDIRRAVADLGLAELPQESTTPDLAELTRRLYDAVNAKDSDGIVSFFRADAVWDQSDAGLGTVEGTAAVRRFVEDWQGSYAEYKVEMGDVLDFGSGVTFAVSVQKGRPAGSTGEVRIRFAAVHSWVDGLIVRLTTYNDIDEARTAAERLAQERE